MVPAGVGDRDQLGWGTSGIGNLGTLGVSSVSFGHWDQLEWGTGNLDPLMLRSVSFGHWDPLELDTPVTGNLDPLVLRSVKFGHRDPLELDTLQALGTPSFETHWHWEPQRIGHWEPLVPGTGIHLFWAPPWGIRYWDPPGQGVCLLGTPQEMSPCSPWTRHDWEMGTHPCWAPPGTSITHQHILGHTGDTTGTHPPPLSPPGLILQHPLDFHTS